MVIHNTIVSTNFMQTEETKKKEGFFGEMLKFTLIALAIVIPVRAFIAQPFIVSGASMDPTFSSGHYLIVDQLTYELKKPEREDVIIFRYPNNPKIFYIKRVIGLPGETISMKDGKITIKNSEYPEGIEIPDPFVSPSKQTKESFSVSLGSTEYFVMGDNRMQSSDSRVWGPLDEKNIIGRPFMRLFPISKISLFPGK